MTGSSTNITIITIIFAVSIALFGFVLAFLISSILTKDQVAADKRLDELKKNEGDSENFALVKHESRIKAKNKEKKKQGGFFEKFASALYIELQRADMKMRPEEFLTIWLLVTVVPAGLIVLFLQNSIVALAVMVVCLFLPMFLIKIKQKQKVKKFESQLSDALIIACSCLKSGLSFSQAMETISKDMDAPISSEFALVIKEMSMGSSMEEALDKMSTRIKSNHLQLMISAVLVQRQTGGNLSQILENISDTIKDRMKLQQELKSATASGKMSGTIVGCMPVAILGMFALVNPDFVTPMFHEKIGIILLCVAGGLEVFCFLLIKKITTIKM